MNLITAIARPIPVCLLPFALVATVLVAGCRSPHPEVSNRMACIIVSNQPSEQIEEAIRAVFERHEYEEGRSEEDELVFEKQGSVMNGVVYGDWYSGGVWERIKIYQRELNPATTLVECDGYMVQQHEDPLFQKEKREYNTKRGHCQRLLDEVARELMSNTNNAAPPHSP